MYIAAGITVWQIGDVHTLATTLYKQEENISFVSAFTVSKHG